MINSDKNVLNSCSSGPYHISRYVELSLASSTQCQFPLSEPLLFVGVDVGEPPTFNESPAASCGGKIGPSMLSTTSEAARKPEISAPWTVAG